ncbi:hypothetical protein OAX78_02355 [Planctomycetota bacterium]|nr:hypothetical protein [Planctomycetota bacterium]
MIHAVRRRGADHEFAGDPVRQALHELDAQVAGDASAGLRCGLHAERRGRRQVGEELLGVAPVDRHLPDLFAVGQLERLHGPERVAARVPQVGERHGAPALQGHHGGVQDRETVEDLPVDLDLARGPVADPSWVHRALEVAALPESDQLVLEPRAVGASTSALATPRAPLAIPDRHVGLVAAVLVLLVADRHELAVVLRVGADLHVVEPQVEDVAVVPPVLERAGRTLASLDRDREVAFLPVKDVGDRADPECARDHGQELRHERPQPGLGLLRDRWVGVLDGVEARVEHGRRDRGLAHVDVGVPVHPLEHLSGHEPGRRLRVDLADDEGRQRGELDRAQGSSRPRGVFERLAVGDHVGGDPGRRRSGAT